MTMPSSPAQLPSGPAILGELTCIHRGANCYALEISVLLGQLRPGTGAAVTLELDHPTAGHFIEVYCGDDVREFIEHVLQLAEKRYYEELAAKQAELKTARASEDVQRELTNHFQIRESQPLLDADGRALLWAVQCYLRAQLPSPVN